MSRHERKARRHDTADRDADPIFKIDTDPSPDTAKTQRLDQGRDDVRREKEDERAFPDRDPARKKTGEF